VFAIAIAASRSETRSTINTNVNICAIKDVPIVQSYAATLGPQRIQELEGICCWESSPVDCSGCSEQRKEEGG
jgi:hypothetical protein